MFPTSRTSLTDGTGDALASFLLGNPALAQRQAGTPSMNMRQTAVDVFVQDDWRVSPSLTVNAGLRYEVQTPLTDIHKILTNLDFSSGVPVAFVGGQNGYPKGLVYADRNNAAPRVGIAWAPGEHRHVVRAGYGIFYSYPDMNLWCNRCTTSRWSFLKSGRAPPRVPSSTGSASRRPCSGRRW